MLFFREREVECNMEGLIVTYVIDFIYECEVLCNTEGFVMGL